MWRLRRGKFLDRRIWHSGLRRDGMCCRGVPLGLRGGGEGVGRGRGGRLLLCLNEGVSKLQDVRGGGDGIYLFEEGQKRNRQHH